MISFYTIESEDPIFAPIKTESEQSVIAHLDRLIDSVELYTLNVTEYRYSKTAEDQKEYVDNWNAEEFYFAAGY